VLCSPAPAMPITMTAQWRLKHREETSRPKTEEKREEKLRHARDGESPLA
jgi:hypothetical protein